MSATVQGWAVLERGKVGGIFLLCPAHEGWTQEQGRSGVFAAAGITVVRVPTASAIAVLTPHAGEGWRGECVHCDPGPWEGKTMPGRGMDVRELQGSGRTEVV